MTVSTGDWTVVETSPTVCRGTDVTVHPDGEHFGYSSFDGHDFYGVLAEWREGGEAVRLRGDWRSPVGSPGGSSWLAHNWFQLYTGDRAGERRRFEVDSEEFCGDEDCEVEMPELEFVSAGYLDEGTALCAVDFEGEPMHLLFDIDRLEPVARVGYGSEECPDRGVVSNGDGVWVTVGDGEVLRAWTR